MVILDSFKKEKIKIRKMTKEISDDFYIIIIILLLLIGSMES